ncbi:hypothetical protein GCM10010441_42970 [Kitasatospora paracochleata]
MPVAQWAGGTVLDGVPAVALHSTGTDRQHRPHDAIAHCGPHPEEHLPVSPANVRCDMPRGAAASRGAPHPGRLRHGHGQGLTASTVTSLPVAPHRLQQPGLRRPRDLGRPSGVTVHDMPRSEQSGRTNLPAVTLCVSIRGRVRETTVAQVA